MMLENFTLKSQEAIAFAQKKAVTLSHQVVDPEHLLMGILKQQGGIVLPVLQKIGANTNKIEEDINKRLESFPKISGDTLAQPYLSNSAHNVLREAQKESEELKDEYVSLEHILIAISNMSNSAVGVILNKEGVTKKAIYAVLKDIRGTQRVTDQNPEEKYHALSKYSIDLTDLAKKGKLDPVIGRDDEVRRVIQVLSRRTKNNPVLIGEAGVGKTAIIEGLAQRIINGDIPETLKDKRLISLDIASLVAGSKYRGEFEDRLKAVLREISDAGADIILFIDEIHSLVGAGASEGSVDASNILKPSLARGELRCVGATTLNEYRKYIEKDAALERRFQPIYVGEPNVEDTIAMLRGLKEKYEVYHGVKIKDSAIIAAAVLSNRYISDRQMPDKAIDLIDEAASKIRIEIDSMPNEIDEIERKIIKIEIEREALKKEKDADEKVDNSRTSQDEPLNKRLMEIDKELAALREAVREKKVRWKNEKDSIHKIRAIKEQIDKAKTEESDYERKGELAKVAEIRYGVISQLNKELNSEYEILNSLQKDCKMLKEQVEDEDIAAVISKWTGVPITRMMETEKYKLLHMEERLSLRVVGQEEAVKTISNAIRRARAGIQEEDRPIGSFIFIGPTGVGKTELARSLAEFLFDDENAIIRVDMSEFMEKHSVARLIGAPPGYVGYDEGGYLTKAVRRRPYSVVLLDEIEKAHAEIFNILLQVLDDGRLTDSHGKTVDFKNTIIIMTSNIGSQLILETTNKAAPFDSGGDIIDDDTKGYITELEEQRRYSEMHDRLMEELRQTFKPEFINRVDEIIIFHNLTVDKIKSIVDIQLNNMKERLRRKGLTLELTKDAKEFLAERGYNPSFGARPLKRAIQRYVQDELAVSLLDEKFAEGDSIVIDRGTNNKLTFTKRN